MVRDVIGTSIGPYRVVSLLGAGGMGEVYRAHDPRLRRDVAIKIIPDFLAREPERLKRFEREAQILAALDHAHIGRIFGVEELGGTYALVLEFVDGATLGERLAAGPLSLSEALSIARQIADALETAHEQGIIHRDLKPANIKVRTDGTVKVLDFGLARMDDPISADDLQAPTITAAATHVGTIMGTAAYMSPEQARGRHVDRRTDIWAFGCVLFEMLSAHRAYESDSTTGTLARILEREPEWQLLPAETPSAIRILLTRCLKKDPRQRLRDIGDARLMIEETLAQPPEDDATQPLRPSRPGPALYIALAAVASAAVTFGLLKAAGRSSPPSTARFDRVVRFIASAAHEFSPVISPDGKWVAYLSNAGGRTDIWLKYISERGDAFNMTQSLDLRVQGTDAIGGIDVSPDGTEIAFIGGTANTLAAQNSVYVIPAPFGGPPRLLIQRRQGLRWSPDGKHLTYIRPGGLRGDSLLISEADGQNEKEIVRREGARHIHQPRWSTDAKYVYFNYGYQNGNAEPTELFRVSVDGGVPEPVVATARRAVAATPSPDGRGIFFAANPDTPDAGIWYRDFGTRRDERITFGVGEYGTPSISSDGRRLVATVSELRQSLVRIPLAGATIPPLEPLTDGNTGDTDPSWSLDGTRLAFSSSRTGHRNIWWAPRGDLSKPQALTTGTAIDEGPVYSPDGTQVAFVSDRQGKRGIWVVSADGGAPRLVVAAPVLLSVLSWSPDGKRLAYSTPGQEVPQIETVEVSTGKTRRLTTDKAANSPAWSPVEDVIAYVETIQDVGSYVRYMTGDGRPLTRGPVDNTTTVNNGFLRWSRDGRRLIAVGMPGNQPGFVYVLDPLERQPARKLVDLGADVYPRGASWNPDGLSVVLGQSKTTADIILAERSR